MAKSNPLKTGYNHYSKSYLDKLNKNDLTDDKNINKINQQELKYSKGWINFCFCLIIVIIALFLGIFIQRPNIITKKTQILDAVDISTGIGFFYHFIGFVHRQSIFMMLKYKMRKLWLWLSMRKLREKRNFLYDPDNAENYIKSYEDYLTYSKNKNQATFKVFYISFLVYGILFLIAIIVTFSLS
ncbi:hypothetical protein [Mycoplasma sp. E35C]|uniref:hypothetical protein n=1 Tax=Mycoplasma sp. E35C TaxID=2801918 RepID=UPI001CA414B7|nr:hypothetical protein [Mycoplasma sp. E35C]QZX48945.1 hypothetical protein JJE79_02715 [Mycoplasma sp. E35C]